MTTKLKRLAESILALDNTEPVSPAGLQGLQLLANEALLEASMMKELDAMPTCESSAPTDAKPVAWLVFAEDTCAPGSPMFPQHPAVPTKKRAEIYASTFGQTKVEVRPLFDRPSATQNVCDADTLGAKP